MRGSHPPRVGTAGWAIPRAVADRFPSEGSGLQRYAAVFNAAEINTTFYRRHKAETFQRWADTTPDGFLFAVKAPRTITHERRLIDVASLLSDFFGDIGNLGDRLGPVLIQLPPTLTYDEALAGRLFRQVRELSAGAIALEPRHATWFESDAEAMQIAHGIARVAADPAKVPAAGRQGGWSGLQYCRMHGSPRMYYSAYGEAELDRLAGDLRAGSGDAWCIFDNTASGAAAADAPRLRDRLV